MTVTSSRVIGLEARTTDSVSKKVSYGALSSVRPRVSLALHTTVKSNILGSLLANASYLRLGPLDCHPGEKIAQDVVGG